MLKILGIFFLFAVFFVIRALMKISKISRNATNRYNRRQGGKDYSADNDSSNKDNPKKFAKEEGRYVDYEEIKEDRKI